MTGIYFFFSVLSKEENLDAEIKKGQDNNLEKKNFSEIERGK